MDKLTAILHVNGRQPVEVEIAVSDVLAIDGPGNIRFVLEPVGFTLGVNRAIPEPVDDGPPAPPRRPALIDYDELLDGDPYHDYPIIARYFPWLADVLPAKYLKEQPVTADRASQDAAQLLPIAHTLRNKKGGWNQSEIARQLGLPQTGGAYGDRVKEAIQELNQRLGRAA